MDEYGCVRDEDDFEHIKQKLEEFGSVVFTYSYDGTGAMIVHIDKEFHKIGTMAFGGNPEGRAFVGILGRGCTHLGFKHTHASYIEEKLNLGKSDAEGFANLWNWMWSEEWREMWSQIP